MLSKMASMKASVCLDINGNELKVTPDRNRKKLQRCSSVKYWIA
jgi:hypothetical protein